MSTTAYAINRLTAIYCFTWPRFSDIVQAWMALNGKCSSATSGTFDTRCLVTSSWARYITTTQQNSSHIWVNWESPKLGCDEISGIERCNQSPAHLPYGIFQCIIVLFVCNPLDLNITCSYPFIEMPFWTENTFAHLEICSRTFHIF